MRPYPKKKIHHKKKAGGVAQGIGLVPQEGNKEGKGR
jgi:hypothetical protein